MKKYIYIVVGLVIGFLVTFFIMKTFQNDFSANESHIIAYEIKRLNKMIVAEQMYSDVYSHKNSRYVPGFQDYFTFDKKVLFLVNAKVQATYDLSKLVVKVDSVNKIIRIEKIPDVEIQTYPDVRFYDMEQSAFNTFSKDELNKVKDNAIAHIEKTINKTKLEKEAHDQLIENLGELYLLAKTYGWKIEDETPYAKELDLKYN